MDNSNIAAIVIVTLATLLVIVLLILKNKKDKKLLNPDAEDVVEESKMDHQRRGDKM